jgi:phage shock protein PspC (stress-responsive transcriptional regulator)
MAEGTLKLYRSTRHGLVGGVCAGLAIRQGWPVSLTRLAGLLIVTATGVGIALYILAWLIVPASDPMVEPAPRAEPVMRDARGGWIGGVCAGLARALGTDVSIVRLAFAALMLLGGTGFLAYLAAWALLPADDGLGAWVG